VIDVSVEQQIYLIALHAHHFMYCTDSHPMPEPCNIQQVVECRCKLIVTKELSKTPPPMVGQTSPPSSFKAEVPLHLVLADFAIDLAI
jgi:hypothetical protein